VVGSAPYALDHINRIADLAASDSRIRLLGSVWDQDQLDQLYTHASTYLHGHSVGGTNPSLLRAMGAGTKVIAWDVIFNREVLGSHGSYFNHADSVAALIEDSEVNPAMVAEVGLALQARAAKLYNWDSVTGSYEGLARRVSVGHSTHQQSSRRAGASTWSLPDTLSRQPSPTPSRGIPL
jgi:glycosyltransferase involved in cell wall biosynthesis